MIRAGFPTIESLRGKSPDDIYSADCSAQGTQVDRCALYCYRLAAHCADHDGQLTEGKQNWWNWKD
ncbi:MAG: helix-hairpin-helix domain-containing protein [Clostridiales bacterium]|nr:helix-hairpin-helix domain-containing protein [Clostridiales bacterium]